MESLNRRLILAGAGLAGVAALAKLAKAGPLEPPQGPITETGVTLASLRDRMASAMGKIARTDQGFAESRTPVQSCPSSPDAQFVISVPGSYYLNDNITGESGKCCIDVQCSDVSIDGNDFTCFGVPGTLACVRTSSSVRAVEMCCMSCRRWHGACIDMANSSECLCEDCSFTECISPPDPVGGGGYCCALGPGSEMCYCDMVSCIGGCVRMGAHGNVESCRSLQCTGGCFSLESDCVCEDCICVDNDGTAVTCLDRCVMCDCQVLRCAGVDFGSQCCISENEFCDCPGAGGGGGGAGGVLYCRGRGCCIDENSITRGTSGGLGAIVVASSGGDALIECNQITGCTVVVELGATGCLCVCNTCRAPGGMQAFSIADGNAYGPIFNVQGVGNIGAMQGSGHSWANYAH